MALLMSNEELKFYPGHPSGAKTHQIETMAMPILEQETPFDVENILRDLVQK